MNSTRHYLRQWRENPVREVLAGSVATFALIPEVIAFSFTAGVDPAVGLYASFVISIMIAIFGGRPAMISAAAGSVALVVAPLVREHGVQYLFAAGLLAGVFQIAFGFARLATLMRYVSRSVRTGFVNALAILIFAAQLPHIVTAGPTGYAVIAAGLAIIYLTPRFTTTIPAPLICVVALTALCSAIGIDIPRVADLGRLPEGLPAFALPDVPLGLDLLNIIFLPALAIAMVGLLESLMTAAVVDDRTGTPSDKNMEARGLGVANVAASLFGGIAGCGMIGQTVSNVKYGGRGRLSTLAAGGVLLLLMVTLRDIVGEVPVAALVAIMIMVSIDTLDWGSLRRLRETPVLSNLVMLATVAMTLVSHNLSLGVLVGVLMSGVFFAAKVARMQSVHRDGDVYTVAGQVFFASADAFTEAFDPIDHDGPVVIDLTNATLWDISALSALEKVKARFAQHGLEVTIRGLSTAIPSRR
ncbi:SulP family inorganic anion transporter [Haematobacter missouriensis]|uniref:Sodium-independent anion transporter n=1 Tax=Haematobacter missouriensis TaxID=366616 RepID=A0A212ALE5_9RHOB|nr:SulP family inorganic anion transporter [Haematobacter missouriensis]OWJ76526.1 sodium-independent anion transporter [Haematobacter missouriensis]OWJ82302.1 sodium-independent anion transporter [Haematobacter missouriensis]